MSVSQVMAGTSADSALSQHHEREKGAARAARERAAEAAQREQQLGQRSRRAPDPKPSYEAFERAHELESTQQVRGSARLAKNDSGDPTSGAEDAGTPEPIPSGNSSLRSIAAAALATSPDTKPADHPQAAPSVLSSAVQTDFNSAGTATLPAQPLQPSAPTPAASEAGAAPESAAPQVTKPSAAQLTTSMEGGGAQHQGSLPVLVAGQLVELDLYALGRLPGGTADNVRRLFLSLNSTSLGPVQLSAESSGNRLRVAVASTLGAAPEVLNEHVRAVGELAARLGWAFESIEPLADAPNVEPGPDGLNRLL